VEGTTAVKICESIIRLGLVSDMGHATYLGRELEKAEIALRTGRSYVQDDPLFKS
jgi:dihydropteroate synthase